MKGDKAGHERRIGTFEGNRVSEKAKTLIGFPGTTNSICGMTTVPPRADNADPFSEKLSAGQLRMAKIWRNNNILATMKLARFYYWQGVVHPHKSYC